MGTMILISVVAILVAIVGSAVIWRLDVARADEIEQPTAPPLRRPLPRPSSAPPPSARPPSDDPAGPAVRRLSRHTTPTGVEPSPPRGRFEETCTAR